MLLEEIQQCTTNVWCIPVEVIHKNEGMARSKASKHHMWIQAVRDPKKSWLEMQYCVTKEEIDWIIRDWPTQWNFLVEKLATRLVVTIPQAQVKCRSRFLNKN
jgi:hypothetical protein